jgi:hypothetical protein
MEGCVANSHLLTGSPQQYRTSQGSTKTMLAHLLQQHLTEDEDLGPAVEVEDARIFLSTKTAAEFAPEDIYMEFATSEQERQRLFDHTRFQLKILRWLVIGQQPFSEAESEVLQTALEECSQEAKLKSRTSDHRLIFQVLDLERQKQKNVFHEHDGVFNFTCDCWSDSEQQEFLGEFTARLVCPHLCKPCPI